MSKPSERDNINKDTKDIYNNNNNKLSFNQVNPISINSIEEEPTNTNLNSNAIIEQFNRVLEKSVRKIRATSYSAAQDSSQSKKSNSLSNNNIISITSERKQNPKKIYNNSTKQNYYPKFPLKSSYQDIISII